MRETTQGVCFRILLRKAAPGHRGKRHPPRSRHEADDAALFRRTIFSPALRRLQRVFDAGPVR
jgi:hypothetical protein